jgi:hypothetical protein
MRECGGSRSKWLLDAEVSVLGGSGDAGVRTVIKGFQKGLQDFWCLGRLGIGLGHQGEQRQVTTLKRGRCRESSDGRAMLVRPEWPHRASASIA